MQFSGLFLLCICIWLQCSLFSSMSPFCPDREKTILSPTTGRCVCKHGYISSADTDTDTGYEVICTPCPLGTFNPIIDSDICLSCAPGSSNAVLGAAACMGCPKNSYATNSGQSKCTLCPHGFVTAGESSVGCIEANSTLIVSPSQSIRRDLPLTIRVGADPRENQLQNAAPVTRATNSFQFLQENENTTTSISDDTSGAVTIAPQLLSATFSSDGTALMIRFSTRTNSPGGIGIYQNCSNYFYFPECSMSSSVWLDDTSAMIVSSGYLKRTTLATPIRLLPQVVRVIGFVPFADDDDFLSPADRNQINNMSVYFPSTVVNITAPSYPVVPTVILLAPTVASICADIQVDISNSIGNLGRPWTSISYVVSTYHPSTSTEFVVLTVSKTTDEISLLSSPKTADTAYQAESQDQPVFLSIPASQLQVGLSYNITVTLCNFLQGCGVSTTLVTVGDDTLDLFPILVFDGSLSRATTSSWSFSSRGRQLAMNLTRATSVDISATAYAVGCNGTVVYSGFTYEWKIYRYNSSVAVATANTAGGGDSAVINLMVESGIENESKDKSKLHVSPYKFPVPHGVAGFEDRYVAVLRSKFMSSGKIATAKVDLYLRRGAVKACLSKLLFDSVRIGERFTLDGSCSYDEDIDPNAKVKGGYPNTKLLTAAWTCVQVTTVGSVSTSEKGCPLLSSSTKSLQFVATPLSNNVSFNAVVTFEITLRVVDLNSWRFGITSIKLARIAQSSSRLSVSVASSLPLPYRSVGNTVLLANLHEVIVLNGTIQTSGACLAVWSLLPVGWPRMRNLDPSFDLKAISLNPLSSYVFDEAITYSNNRGSNTGVTTLPTVQPSPPLFTRQVLLSVQLTYALPTYRFSLKCGNASATSVVIKINNGPQSGTFKVTPTTGYELRTQFIFLSSLWIDEELPLSYEFGVLPTMLTIPLIFRLRASQPIDFSVLPAGWQLNHFNLTCVTVVHDSVGAKTQVSAQVRVLPSKDPDQAHKALAGMLLQVESSGSINVLERALALAAHVTSTGNCSMAPTDCSSKLKRHGCTVVPHSCGACLDGYFGEAGSANTACLSLSEVSSVTSAARNGTKCHTDKDCQHGSTSTTNAVCNQAYHLCEMPIKSCPTDASDDTTTGCSNGGLCRFFDIVTGLAIDTCLANDYSCQAACVCPSGFGGLACDVGPSALNYTSTVRSSLLNSLQVLNELEGDLGRDSRTSWLHRLSSLALITSNPYIMNAASVSTSHSVLKIILEDISKVQSSGTVTQLQRATKAALSTSLAIMESVITAQSVINRATTLAQTRLLSTNSNSINNSYSSGDDSSSAGAVDLFAALTDEMDLLCSIVASSLVEGENGVYLSNSKLRITVDYVISSDNSANLSVPVRPGDVLLSSAGDPSPSYALLSAGISSSDNSQRTPQHLQLKLSSCLVSYNAELSDWRDVVSTAARPRQPSQRELISDPLRLRVQSLSNAFGSFPIGFLNVTFQIKNSLQPHFLTPLLGRTLSSSQRFETLCSYDANGIITNTSATTRSSANATEFEYACADSGYVIRHVCPTSSPRGGGAGTFSLSTQCPNTTAVAQCDLLTSNSNDIIIERNNFYLHGCQTVSYDAHRTVCLCQFVHRPSISKGNMVDTSMSNIHNDNNSIVDASFSSDEGGILLEVSAFAKSVPLARPFTQAKFVVNAPLSKPPTTRIVTSAPTTASAVAVGTDSAGNDNAYYISLLPFALLWAVGGYCVLLLVNFRYRQTQLVPTTGDGNSTACDTNNQGDDVDIKSCVGKVNMKAQLISYACSVFPEVFCPSKSFLQLVLGEFMAHHSVNTNGSSVRSQSVAVLKAMTSLSLCMLLVGVFLNLNGDLATRCLQQVSEVECESQHTVLDRQQATCQWHYESAISGSHPYCQPIDSRDMSSAYYASVMVCVLASMAVLKCPIDALFSSLLAPPLKQTPMGPTSNHPDPQQPLTIVHPALTTTQSSSAAAIVFDRSLATKITRIVPDSVRAAQELATAYASTAQNTLRNWRKDQDQIHANRNRNLSPARNRDLSGKKMRSGSYESPSSHGCHMKILGGINEVDEDVDYDASHIRSEAVASTAGVEVKQSQFDEFKSEVHFQRRLLGYDELPLFDYCWGDLLQPSDDKNPSSQLVEVSGTSSDSTSFAFSSCLRMSRRPQIGAVEGVLRRELDAIEHHTVAAIDKLRLSDKKQVGLELLHLFIIDLMGRDSIASRVFKMKAARHFQKLPDHRIHHAVLWSLVFACNALAVCWSMAVGAAMPMERQIVFAIGCTVVCSAQVFVVAFERLVMDVALPRLLGFPAIHHARCTLMESIDKLCDDNESNDASLAAFHRQYLNVPHYLFLSTNVATAFPDSIESAIVRSYSSYLPGKVSDKWLTADLNSWSISESSYLSYSSSEFLVAACGAVLWTAARVVLLSDLWNRLGRQFVLRVPFVLQGLCCRLALIGTVALVLYTILSRPMSIAAVSSLTYFAAVAVVSIIQIRERQVKAAQWERRISVDPSKSSLRRHLPQAQTHQDEPYDL